MTTSICYMSERIKDPRKAEKEEDKDWRLAIDFLD
jgi:hypothetical protein